MVEPALYVLDATGTRIFPADVELASAPVASVDARRNVPPALKLSDPVPVIFVTPTSSVLPEATTKPKAPNVALWALLNTWVPFPSKTIVQFPPDFVIAPLPVQVKFFPTFT